MCKLTIQMDSNSTRKHTLSGGEERSPLGITIQTGMKRLTQTRINQNQTTKDWWRNTIWEQQDKWTTKLRPRTRKNNENTLRRRKRGKGRRRRWCVNRRKGPTAPDNRKTLVPCVRMEREHIGGSERQGDRKLGYTYFQKGGGIQFKSDVLKCYSSLVLFI